MFGLLKFLFYSCVAVVVGVVIGTVPFGGRTVAERIASVYQPAGAAAEAPKKALPAPKASARTAPRSKSGATAPALVAMAQGPLTAGAANTPDGHTESDKRALDKLIASKSKAK
jgi:hypothetical protein